MSDDQKKPRVIEYVPKNRSLFSWNVAGGLILLWIAVLIGAILLKQRMFQMLWPVVFVILLVYLFVCTLLALRRK